MSHFAWPIEKGERIKKEEEEKNVTYASKRCHVTEALLYTCSLVCWFKQTNRNKTIRKSGTVINWRRITFLYAANGFPFTGVRRRRRTKQRLAHPHLHATLTLTWRTRRTLDVDHWAAAEERWRWAVVTNVNFLTCVVGLISCNCPFFVLFFVFSGAALLFMPRGPSIPSGWSLQRENKSLIWINVIN